MTRIQKISFVPLLLALLTFQVSPSRAASLLLDFGPTATVFPDSTSSMGHFAGAVPESEAIWNTITGDVANGLVFSDGTPASGISVDLGRTDAGSSNTINFNINVFNSSNLGGQINAGIYSGTSPIKDGLFAPGTTTVGTNAFGVRVNGLPPGTYTLYISGRNTSTAVHAAQRFFSTNGPSADSFTFTTNSTPWIEQANSATAPGNIPTQADAVTDTFAYGDNCAHLVTTVGAGESLYFAVTGAAANEARGFLNALEIVPGLPVLTNFPATVGAQPAGRSVYEGATVSLDNARFGGVPPLYFQWYFNDAIIPDATNAILTIENATTGMAGNYRVAVSNAIAVEFSSDAVVTVVPLFNTGQASNIWNLLPGDRFYITVTNNTSGERGLAYNPVTTNLLLVSQIPTNNVVVLDATTGEEKHFLDLSGIPQTASGINMIGVADDGVIYAVNATANAGSPSTPFMLWQWADDDAATAPVQLLAGDPGFFTDAVGLRWGDNIAVRGAGLDTQILIAPGSGSYVCLFTTSDGFTFMPTILTISDVPSGFARFGIAFGPEENTFWAKTLNEELYLIQFDLNTLSGTVVNTYGPADGVPNTFRFISTDKDQKWMAGVMSVAPGLSDNVRLYDISNLADGPVLKDQELYATQNANSFLNGAGTGSTAIGGNFVFALDSQNGIKAFLINTDFTPSLDSFEIISIKAQAGPQVVLTFESVPGHTYRVQSKAALSDPEWTNLGEEIVATAATTSVTNSVSVASRFYRIQGQ